VGSYIELRLAGHTIDWTKNGLGAEHGKLFQAGDLGMAPYDYVDDDGSPIVEMKEVATRPLSRVVSRLELLGFDIRRSAELVADALFDYEETFNSMDLEEAEITKFTCLRYAPGKASVAQFAKHFAADFFSAHETDELFGVGEFLSPIYEYLNDAGAYAVLRLLAEDQALLKEDVTWNFADLVEGGWVERDTVTKSLGKVRPFLIVTEGSSDAKIIRHALDLLRPDIADFFRFIDMDKGYPFSGSGDLHRFCKGLVSIGIENNVIALFDNDTEGCRGFCSTSQLALPQNIKVIKLPVCDQLRRFPTIGPDGPGHADINGSAASIECFLDLAQRCDGPARVRWTNYDKLQKSWQGALIGKERYVRKFLKSKVHDPSYDYTKLQLVLDVIVSTAVALSGSAALVSQR
jgi:hypothetical protein